jgi:hypothetical protein
MFIVRDKDGRINMASSDVTEVSVFCAERLADYLTNAEPTMNTDDTSWATAIACMVRARTWYAYVCRDLDKQAKRIPFCEGWTLEVAHDAELDEAKRKSGMAAFLYTLNSNGDERELTMLDGGEPVTFAWREVFDADGDLLGIQFHVNGVKSTPRAATLAHINATMG